MKKNRFSENTIMVTVIFFLLSSFYSLALPPDLSWAKNAGGTGYDEDRGVATDINGNVLVTGYFYSTTLTFGNTTLTNTGGSDIFIVKYDGSGNVLWAKSAGGISSDVGNSVATDFNGNVFVTGNFNSPALTFGTTTLTNLGGPDIFIVKYDGSGNVFWAKSAGGTDYDGFSSVATDANGNVLITGAFYNTTITFGTTTLTNAGGMDIFIVKYDDSGNVLWAKSAGGTINDLGNSVAIDANRNVLITGVFYSSTLTFGTTTLTNTGGLDIFIVKYDGSGNVLWAKSAGGTSLDDGTSIATDANGNVLVTGDFESPTLTFGSTTLTNAGTNDIFIVKYDGKGNVLWAKSAGGISSDGGNSIASDANGNILVTGVFYSSTLTFGATTLTNAGGADIFMVKYDEIGNVLWAKSVGGTGHDEGRGVATNGSGNMIVTGSFYSPTLNFEATTLTNVDASGYSPDIFIVKLSFNSSSINEDINQNSRLQIFPNPSSGKFTLRLYTKKNYTASFSVYNVLGKKIIHWNDYLTTYYSEEINLEGNPAGVYFLQIMTPHWGEVRKIVMD